MSTQQPVQGTADDDYDDGPSLNLVDVLTWMGEGKRKIAVITAVVALAAVGVSLVLPKQYTATTTLLPPNSQQQSGSAAALAALGSLGGITSGISAKTPDELYVSLLRSDTVQRGLDKRFDLKARYEVETHAAMARELSKSTRITSEKKSGLITLEVDDRDPKFAAELANAHTGEIMKLLSKLAVTEAQQRRVFFEQQLKETKENLIGAEQALRTVQEKSGMVVLDKQAEAIIAAVAQLKTRIAEREVQLRVLRTSTTAENPDVRRLNSEVGALRAELARMESAPEAGGKETRENGLDIPVGKLPSAAIDYIRATREVKFQETMMASMLRQFEVAKMDEAKDAPALQQVDVAQPPEFKSKPRRAIIVLGAALVAFLLSTVWVIWRGAARAAHQQDPARSEAMAGLSRAWRIRG